MKNAKIMKRGSLRKKQDRQKLLMCVLPLVKIILFSYVPMVGLIIAFQNFKPRTLFLSEWVGFSNFRFIFANPDFMKLILNAVILNALYITFGTIVSVIIALFLFEFSNRIFLRTVQTTVLMPFFVAWPLVGMFAVSFLGSNGVITGLIQTISGKRIDFYSNPQYWRIIITVIYVWKSMGISMIAYYAVLLNTDKEIYEAAEMDGASRFQKMLLISLSNLKYMIIIGVIMNCGNIIRSDFSMNFFIIGGNSALYPTVDILESYMYRALMNASSYGNMIAMGLFQGVVGLVLSLIANFIVRRFDKEASIF